MFDKKNAYDLLDEFLLSYHFKKIIKLIFQSIQLEILNNERLHLLLKAKIQYYIERKYAKIILIFLKSARLLLWRLFLLALCKTTECLCTSELPFENSKWV